MMKRERPITTQTFFSQSQTQGSRNSEIPALAGAKKAGKTVILYLWMSPFAKPRLRFT